MSGEALGRWKTAIVEYVRSGEPDLTNRQMAILMLTYASSEPHTVRGIAQKLGVSKPEVTRALNTLSALGYLRRERDESDRSNIFIAQTLDGARFLERFEKIIGPDRPVRKHRRGVAAID